MNQQAFQWGPGYGQNPPGTFAHSPPGLDSINSPPGPKIPGLDPQNSFASQAAFEYSRASIPGLSFATPTTAPSPTTAPMASNPDSWKGQPSDVPPNPGYAPSRGSHTHSSIPFQPQYARTVITNNTTPQPVTTEVPAEESYPAVTDNATNANADDVMEEGELDESGFEDLYEPYLEPGDSTNYHPPSQSEHPATDDEDYDPARPASPSLQDTTLPNQDDSDAVAITVRERSRSYSPYLSPGELSTTSPSPQQSGANGLDTLPQTTSAQTMDKDLATTAESPAEAKKKAQASILRLWPLEVRFQDYVDEGIDPKIVRDLFAGLGLDTKSSKAPAKQQPLPKNHAEVQPSKNVNPQPIDTQPQSDTISTPTTAPSKPPAATASQKQEERKDRIARLLAAKNAKQQSSSTGAVEGTVGAPASTGDTAPSSVALPVPQLPVHQVSVAADADKASKKAEKERLLQLKLEALQMSRALRAQNTASNTTETQHPEPERDSNASDRNMGSIEQTSMAPSPQAPNDRDTQPHDKQALPGAIPAGPIPGLSLSATAQSAPTIPRKRPTASDLNETSIAPPFKRTFSQHQVETPLIINVSDESEDEDVEMEISSQVDDTPYEPNHNGHRLPPSQDPTSLAEMRHQRGFATPTSLPGGTATPKQPDSAELQRINHDIDEMKRKIAEAERRKKAKLASKDATAQQPSIGPGTAGVSLPLIPGPSSVHSQSSSSLASQPAPSPSGITDDVQRVLPKAPRGVAADHSQRTQRLRVVSETLPTLEAKLRSKTTKLRLLKSEVTRIEREVDEILAEQADLASELETLSKDENGTTSEPRALQEESSSNSDLPTPQYPSQVLEIDDESAPTELSQIANGTEDLLPTTRSELTEPQAQPGEETSPSRRIQDRDINGSNGLEDVPPGGIASESEAAVVEPVEDTQMVDVPSSQSEGPVVEEQPAAGSAAEQDEMAVDGEPYSPPEPFPHPLEMQTADHDTAISPPPADTDMQEAQLSLAPTSISDGAADTSEASPGSLRDASCAPPNAPEPAATHEFAPYKSVLKEFLSYRFHPNFHNDVTQGLRSLTYSNKINPHVPFCLDSLLPEGCPRGASCELQHPGSIEIPDSQILLQLGNSERLEGKEQERYIDGLRALLSEFKAKQSKDFDVISKAIVDYRTRFYGDQSRVLPLGNISV